MKFWTKRKKSSHTKTAELSLERLEDRAMMAVIPLASGQTATFHDSDGSEVKVKLVGPGQGTIELVGGVLTGAAIDTLSLTGTTGASKLKISARGGSVAGTSVNDVVIDNAIGQLGALKHFKGKHVTLTGDFTADGDIEDFCVRTLGSGSNVNINGNVGRFKAESLATNAQLEIAGTLREFVAKLLASGSVVEANQIDLLKVKQQAVGASFNVGDGGLARAKLGWIYDTNFMAEGTIGDIVVKGDAMGTAFASNINKGSDEVFGTIDDLVVDQSADGYIQSVKFRGTIGGAGSQRVAIVSSGQVGDVQLNRAMAAQGTTPLIWEQAASSYTPLSIVQASLNAAGFSDDEIYVAVFGQSIPSGAAAGPSYYLAPTTPGSVGALTATSTLQPGPTTPDLVTLPSYTITQWKDTTQTWGSDLVFPTPPPSSEWSGRIVISAGVPVQAQISANGTVSAPNPTDPTDPSTGTFYDFVEFTVTADASGNPTLDADTSQVDSFGMPLALQFFQPNPTVVSFTGTTAQNSATITGIASTTGLVQGQYVVGTGIPAGAVIQSVTSSTVTLNMPASIAGTPILSAASWTAYSSTFTGTAANGSSTLNNVSTLQSLVLNDYLGTGQPVVASGILAPGTTIVAYDIDAQTITLSKPAIASTPAMSSTTFAFNAAGPVGVEATRDSITSASNANGLTQFLQGLVQGGNNQARPFLLSSAPFVTNGPVPIDNASSGATPITITTTAASGLQNGNLIEIDGVLGNTAANGVYQVVSPGANSFVLGSPIANGTYTSGGAWAEITPYGITNATASSGEVMITAPTTGLMNGDTVVVTGVVGNTGANGTFTVSNVTTSTFILSGSTSAGSYAYGGYWYEQPTITTPITGASSGAITISTANTGSLSQNDFVVISGVGGNTAANGVFQVGTVNANTSFELGGPLASGGYASLGTWSLSVTGTSTGQSVITSSSTTGLSNGDTVTISGVLNNSAVIGEFIVGSVTPNSFALTAPVGNGAYTSGGTWNLVGSATNVPITSVTGDDAAIVVTSASVTGIEVGQIVNIQGVGGNTAGNGMFVVSALTATTITLGSPVSPTASTANTGAWNNGTVSGAVVGASRGGEVIITTANTVGLENGDLVEVTGVGGTTSANNVYYVSGVTTGGTTFTLDGSIYDNAYTFGGTWKEYAALTRLISPKDLVESLSSPEDLSALNNYYNELVDEFFLYYYTGTINSQTGGGNTFNLVSTAFNGTPLTYSGSVQQVTIDGQYTGYALQLTDMSNTDSTTYNIVYPFFTTNAPAPEIHTPLFGTAAPPAWLVANSQQFESASQMIFACDSVFADNTERAKIDMTGTNAVSVLGDLENSISAAFNRGIIMNAPSTWSDSSQWFPSGGTYNYWTEYWHQTGLTFGDLAYAFPYDDKFGASTNLEIPDVGLAQITLGNWSDGSKAVADLVVALDSSTPAPIDQQGSAEFDISFTNSGATPTGTVALFLNGIALNSNNNSSGPPVQFQNLTSGVASLTANLPPTGDAGNAHTYTVTAVYSGDENYLPTIASITLQIAAV